MNFLKRDLAPIGQKAWDEIDATAKTALTTALSGRKVVDVDGPHGLACASVPLGRLSVPEAQDGTAVKFGIHQVLPLVETRIPFSLPIWELDNVERGAVDIDLDPVIAACREIAAFENSAIFDGFKKSGIVGLQQALKGPRLALSLDANPFLETIAEAMAQLRKDGIKGGADLVVSAAVWKFLAHSAPSGSLKSIVEKQIGGRVIYADAVKDALLIANSDEAATLTIGQDFAIGYHHHTAEEVTLFITESFTFRVVTPEALIGFSIGKKK